MPASYILIQAVGLIGTVLFFLSFQCRSNRNLFRVQFLSYLFYTAHLLLLGAITGGVSYIINTLRSLFLGSRWKFTQKWQMGLVICLLQLGALALTWAGPISLLPVAANIASTMYELIQGLPREGSFAVFGSGDDYIDRLYAMCKKEKVRVSLDPRADAWMTAEGISYSDRGTSFTLVCEGERHACRTPLLGSFNVKNILLAAAMARRLEVPMEDIVGAIRTLEPIEHRLQLTVEDLNVIDDTLNEDPDSAFEALRVLSQMPGRRIVVSPGLNGLHQQEAEVNYALGTVMADSADTVILVGTRNSQRSMRRGLIQSGFSRSNLHAVDDMDDASELLEEISEHGDTVLFESRVPEYEEE